MNKKINLLIIATIFSFIGLYAQTSKSMKEPGIYATFMTDSGDIIIKLEHEKAPMTVCNFVGLAEGSMENSAKPAGTPYYDGLTFHRVITRANGDAQDFMIQGGDPQGTGSGGPGYKFPDEFDETLKHSSPGILSMANAGPGTNGSQFFITVAPTPWLDNRHTIFGRVVEGIEVANKIRKGNLINKLKIDRIGKDAENFKADKKAFDSYLENIEKKAQEKQQKELMEFVTWVKQNYPKAMIKKSGLAYIMEKPGEGPEAKNGDKVSVHYNGTFPDGKVFDNSYKRGEPIEFDLGKGMVIPGWEEGIQLLSKGGKVKLIIPYWLAYGAQGRGPIPPKATLIFDTEMVDIK